MLPGGEKGEKRITSNEVLRNGTSRDRHPRATYLLVVVAVLIAAPNNPKDLYERYYSDKSDTRTATWKAERWKRGR